MRTSRRISRLLAAGMAGHLGAAVAYAQTPTTLPGEAGIALQWAIAAGIVIICCFSAFLNPKRSHLN